LAYCQYISSAIGSEMHAVILGEKRHFADVRGYKAHVEYWNSKL